MFADCIGVINKPVLGSELISTTGPQKTHVLSNTRVLRRLAINGEQGTAQWTREKLIE